MRTAACKDATGVEQLHSCCGEPLGAILYKLVGLFQGCFSRLLLRACKYDAKADLWSIGAILCELVRGCFGFVSIAVLLTAACLRGCRRGGAAVHWGHPARAAEVPWVEALLTGSVEATLQGSSCCCCSPAGRTPR